MKTLNIKKQNILCKKRKVQELFKSKYAVSKIARQTGMASSKVCCLIKRNSILNKPKLKTRKNITDSIKKMIESERMDELGVGTRTVAKCLKNIRIHWLLLLFHVISPDQRFKNI